ncbi:MAG: SH3 domain-containing protein [Bacteroidota bacterium]
MHIQGQNLATINDPDGYVNIREGKGTHTEIVGKLLEDEIFYFYEGENQEWYSIYKFDMPLNHSRKGFVHKSRIKEINSLRSIGRKGAISRGRAISNDTLNFSIVLKDFDRLKRKYELQDEKWVVKIDNKHPWGVDGGYPTTEIQSLQLKINGKTISFPKDAYIDVFELDLRSLKIYQNTSGTLFITTSNSDGAGYYDLVWKIQDNTYKGRFIGVF